MQSAPSMAGKTCLVTGANQGIGKETAIGLAQRGATVVITSRDRARGEAAINEIKQRTGNEDVSLMPVDFASLASIRQFAADFLAAHTQLHVLVNNAGAYNATRTLTADGFETTFGVNHLGYFLTTKLLLDAIKASAPARIVSVSSAAHARANGALCRFLECLLRRYAEQRRECSRAARGRGHGLSEGRPRSIDSGADGDRTGGRRRR